MKRTWKPFLIIGISLILLTPLPIFMVTRERTLKGSLEPHWSSPKGIRLSDAREGDDFTIEYSASENVSVYLLTKDQADEMRSPRFYKEPLPTPLFEGNNCKLKTEFGSSGDYEIVFLPVDGSFDFNVDYRISGLRTDNTIYIISAVGLIVLSVILIVYSLTIRRVNRKIGHG
ncbi:MAG: hypothetical protein ACMUIE_08020 [Thermoplasmatota archaeon]